MSPRRRRTSSPEPEQVLYLPQGTAPGREAVLSGGEAEHARRSLRIRVGDALVLADGRGSRYRGQVSGLGKFEVRVQVETVETLTKWPPREIWLGAGVLRSTRMDFLVEKASELGVSRLSPLRLEHSVARPHEEGSKAERWQRLAVESMKQSRRGVLMDVRPPGTLPEFLEEAPPGSEIWVADPGGEGPPRTGPPGPGAPLILVVGPEGGLSGAEIELLGVRGARRVSLGGHRLRAETAALTLVAAGLTVLGALGQPAPPA